MGAFCVAVEPVPERATGILPVSDHGQDGRATSLPLAANRLLFKSARVNLNLLEAERPHQLKNGFKSSGRHPSGKVNLKHDELARRITQGLLETPDHGGLVPLHINLNGQRRGETLFRNKLISLDNLYDFRARNP